MLNDKLTVASETISPTVCVNSFPKSGTHLISLFVAAIFPNQVGEIGGKPAGDFSGSFYNNAWSTDWIPFEQVQSYITQQKPGSWMKSHYGYADEYEQAFNDRGTSVIFVYRDLRDVIVSLAYHIESEKERLKHPERGKFNYFPSHEDRLLAVIEGTGKDPGIIERWEKYAGWLDVPWVLPIRYEDALHNKKGTAEMITQYIIKRTAHHNKAMPVVMAEQYKATIKRALYFASRPDFSPTFRVGRSGSWFHEFSPAVLEAFIRHGGNHWLRKLDYIAVEEITHGV